MVMQAGRNRIACPGQNGLARGLQQPGWSMTAGLSQNGSHTSGIAASNPAPSARKIYEKQRLAPPPGGVFVCGFVHATAGRHAGRRAAHVERRSVDERRATPASRQAALTARWENEHWFCSPTGVPGVPGGALSDRALDTPACMRYGLRPRDREALLRIFTSAGTHPSGTSADAKRRSQLGQSHRS